MLDIDHVTWRTSNLLLGNRTCSISSNKIAPVKNGAIFLHGRRAILWSMKNKSNFMVPFNGAILWHVCTRHKLQNTEYRSRYSTVVHWRLEPNRIFSIQLSVFHIFSTWNIDVENSLSVLVVEYRILVPFLRHIDPWIAFSATFWWTNSTVSALSYVVSQTIITHKLITFACSLWWKRFIFSNGSSWWPCTWWTSVLTKINHLEHESI